MNRSFPREHFTPPCSDCNECESECTKPSAAYDEYVASNEQLTKLAAEGKDDTDEANELCDVMDGQWSRMTDAEQEKARKQPQKVV